MRPKITALAITLNEETNIKRYVESLDFVDEIIFIDSISTDATVKLATELGVKVIQNKFEDFSSQRNFAIEQAKNDWIVFFDLDEIISPKLRTEIVNAISEPNNYKAYKVKRNFYFLGKHIKYGGWQSDKAIRVFNKQMGKYNGNLVHEGIITSHRVGQLKESVDHYSYKNFDTYKQKLNLYSDLQAETLYNKGVKPNVYHFFIRPCYRFLWQYIYRLGFLDGKEGFILAYLHASSVYNRYIKLSMKHKEIN